MASWSKRISLMIDTSHNNLVSPQDPDFSHFFDFLENRGYNIHLTDSNKKLTSNSFDNIRTFIIGVPQNAYLLIEEISDILNFVRKGGSLLIIHRFGGDFIQKTNLNDLTSHFGIYFENSIIKDVNNLGIEAIPLINSFSFTQIMDGINKLVFPGTCSLRLAKNSQELCQSSKSSWVEIFNPKSFEWDKYNSIETYSETYPIAAYAIYGQGRIISFGTPDFLVNEPVFGIDSLDNRMFFLNCLKWLMDPVSKMEIDDWTLQQLSMISEDLMLLKNESHQIHKLMEVYEKRIRDLEYKSFSKKNEN